MMSNKISYYLKLTTAALVLSLSNNLLAECDFNASFPAAACPFTDQEKISVKFGFISFGGFVNSNNEIPIRFNSVQYRAKIGTKWQDNTCIEHTAADSTSLDDLGNIIFDIKFRDGGDQTNDYIAFTVDPDNGREITKIWFIDCEVENLDR